MPRCADLALDQAREQLFNVSFFTSDGVENSINAVELKRVRRLVGKCGCEVIHSMLKHVHAVNMHVLRVRVEKLSWRRRDSTQ